jgi:hypothetical protein
LENYLVFSIILHKHFKIFEIGKQKYKTQKKIIVTNKILRKVQTKFHRILLSNTKLHFRCRKYNVQPTVLEPNDMVWILGWIEEIKNNISQIAWGLVYFSPEDFAFCMETAQNFGKWK